MSAVADDRIFRKNKIERDSKESYDAICQLSRKILKPDVAEAFIATQIDGITIRDYVTETAKAGGDIAKFESNLYKKLTRTVQKLAVAYPKCNI